MASMAPTLRPLCCWKSMLRHSRRQKALSRTLTTYHKATAHTEEPPRVLQTLKSGHAVRRIKVFPPPPTPATSFKDPIASLTRDQLTVLDPNNSRSNLFDKLNEEGAKVGDILLVRLKNGDPFAGVCINIRRQGIDSAILLRNQLTRVGVEMWYKIYSPNVEGIEVVKRRERRARRARLTYMRKPKHDAGSVQNIVSAYMRTRNVLRGGGGGPRVEHKGGKKKKGSKKR